MGELGPKNCEGRPLAPRAKQVFGTLRVVYGATEISGGLPSFEDFVRPATLTELVNANAPEPGECAIANVSLHGQACVRYDPTASAAIPQQFPRFADGDAVPWSTSEVLPAPPLDCDIVTTGSGVAFPQYRVRFKDGTSQTQEVWTDGNAVLSLPADNVDVHLVTPPLVNQAQVDASDLEVPAGTLVAPGLSVDAIANASVEWGSRNSLPAGPGGMLTWTQHRMVTGPVEGGAFPILFERPPFARRVCVARSPSLPVAASPAFQVSGTGLVLNSVLAFPIAEDVMAATTQVLVTPTLVPAGAVGVVTCIWELGVR